MSTFHYRINVEPCEAPPEPVIGPGMIIERGRVRYCVRFATRESDLWWTKRWKKWPWCRGWSEGFGYDFSRDDIREMLASGFRVIRPADPTSQQGKE